MRKSHFFSVLSLFLLVPASITWAQTVSVTGNVYEKNTIKNSFTTPHGIIKTILPDDMATGDIITGTVLYEPAGNSPKKKKANLEQLTKYVFSLENGTRVLGKLNEDTPMDRIDESPVSRRASLTIPSSNDPSSFRLYLKNAGDKMIGEAKLPLVDQVFLIPGGAKSTATSATIQTDKKIYLSGENATISLPLVFGKVDFEYSFISFASLSSPVPGRIALQSLAGSPRKIIVQIPATVSGPGIIALEDKSKLTLASQKIHVLKLEASCPKTNLLKGEKTTLNVVVQGLEQYPADYLRLSLDNTTAGFVQLGVSNHEELVLEPLSMNYSKVKRDYRRQDKKNSKEAAQNNQEKYQSNQFSLERSITALQSGGFVINVGLSYPSSVYNEPFRQQLDVLKTVQQFNNWQNALKNDLVLLQVRTQTLGEHISDGMITHRFAPIASPGVLEEAKAGVYSIISWPRIGQEVVVDFICTLEAGKAAIENGMNNPGNETVNYEVIQAALKHIEHRASVAADKRLSDAASSFLQEDLWKRQKQFSNTSDVIRLLSSIQHVFNGAVETGSKNMQPPVFNINAGTYIANEIAGNPCQPEGETTVSWLYIEKPCRVEMATTRASSIDPDEEDILNKIQDLLGEVSEDGAELGGKLAKTFSISKSFAVWIRVVRDWESYKAEYVCHNGVWQHGEMKLANSGVKEICTWELFRGESGNDTWVQGDDMGWIMKQAEELKNKCCK
ncbi:MAG: hypothetical protein ABIR30_12510 [Chitinophagaceae bacterium]